jgi:predicted O-methyltransferase YrrM
MAAKEDREPPYPKIMHGVKGHISRREAKFLRDTPARMGPGQYAELGTYRGKSTLCTADGMKDSDIDAHIITVDAWDLIGGPEHREPKYRHDQFDNTRACFIERGVGKYITMVKGFTAPTASMFQGNKFIFMFIDADHKYEGVKADFEAWSPLIISGGEIAFHDTQLEDVERCVNEIPWDTYMADTITVKIKP